MTRWPPRLLLIPATCCLVPGPEGKLDKKKYLAMLQFYNLRGAFPDLDQRAHDFRVDKFEPTRVWFTTRVTGTHKGGCSAASQPLTGLLVDAGLSVLAVGWRRVRRQDRAA